VITDSLIAVAYYSIPVALFLLAIKKKEAIPVRPLFMLFGLFIFFFGGGRARPASHTIPGAPRRDQKRD